MIRTIKEVIRKYLSRYTDCYWSEFVTQALILLRFTTSRAHGFTPYQLTTGWPPPLPPIISNSPHIFAQNRELTSDEEEEYALDLFSTALRLQELASTARHH